MIEGYNAVTQALLGTLLTWGLTAAGAGLVIFLRGNHVSHLNFYRSRSAMTIFLSIFCSAKRWIFRWVLVLV